MPRFNHREESTASGWKRIGSWATCHWRVCRKTPQESVEEPVAVEAIAEPKAPEPKPEFKQASFRKRFEKQAKAWQFALW